MTDAVRDQNFVPVALGQSNANPNVTLPFLVDSVTGRLLTDVAGGSGTVTSVSVATANGFAGTVSNPTTTPEITISTTVTGILSGNGTAVSAASTTGSGAVVLENTPTLITPNIGAATGTSLTTTGALRSNTSLILEETGAGTDTITIQAPASIAASYTLTLPVDDGTNLQFLQTDGNGVLAWASGGAGTVVTVVGTANRISVDSTDPANPIVNISTNYVGQATITTLGTITTGTWNATVVAGQYGGTGVANTGKTITVSGNTTIGSSTDTVAFATSGNTSVTLPTSGTLATTTQIANMVTAASTFATDESILRADGTSRGAQATSTNATLTDAGAMTLASTATATAFIPSGSSAPTNGMYLPAANTLGWAVNSAAEIQLTSTALSPAVDGGNSLGTTTLGWQNLFANTGFVLNIENSDWVATHTTGILTVGTGDLRVTNAGTNSASAVTVGGTQTLTNKTLSSPSITGTALLAEGAGIGLDPVLSADGTWTGITMTATAGYTQAFGDLVYLSVTDSRWELADADAASTAGPVALAMVVVAGTDGNSCTLLLQGVIRADAKFPTMTVGATQYVGETAGAIQGTIPTGADNIIRTVGYALTADALYFNPSTDWQVTVA